jgi:hypothetical protein
MAQRVRKGGPQDGMRKLLDEQRQSGDAKGCLRGEKHAGNPEKWAAVAGFEDIRKDASHEAQQEGNGPQAWLAGGSSGDGDEENGSHNERSSVAKIAAAARGNIKGECGDDRDCKRGVGERGEEDVCGFK